MTSKKLEFGFVYLINAYPTNKYKIGRAKDIKSRIASMQTGCPFKLRYVHSCFTKNPADVESALHSKHSKKNCILEWFEFEEEDIKSVIELLSLCHDGNALRYFSSPFEHALDETNVADENEDIEVSESLETSVAEESQNIGNASASEMILRFTKRKGVVTASQCKSGIRMLRNFSTSDIRDLFRQLQEQGKGYCIGETNEALGFSLINPQSALNLIQKKGDEISARDLMRNLSSAKGLSSEEVRAFLFEISDIYGGFAVSNIKDFDKHLLIKDKMIDLSKSRGWLSARDVISGIKLARDCTASQIRDLMYELHEEGAGFLRGCGEKMQWSYELNSFPPIEIVEHHSIFDVVV